MIRIDFRKHNKWNWTEVIRPINQWDVMGLDTDGCVVKTLAGHELVKIAARCATDESANEAACKRGRV